MYKIIGADQKEYGPVSVDQIRQWIAEGRANAETKAQAEGTDEWKLLSAFPELADALAAKAGAAARVSLPIEQDRAISELLQRDYQLDIGRCYSRSWQLLMKHFGLLVGATAVITLVEIGIGFIPVVGNVIGLALGFVFWAGLYWLFLKLIRGQSASFEDAFAGFQINFVQLLLASIVAQLLTFVGFLFCLLPGIYLLVVWLVFAPILVIDKRMEFWPAMELSRKVVHKHWWQVFAFLLVGFLALVVGALALVVGIFVALPLVAGATAYAYEDTFGPGITTTA